MPPLVSAAEARRIFDEQFQVRDRAESVPTGEALGRVLAEEVRSPEELPPFARSLMDGYAVRAADTYGASEGLPSYLDLAGAVRDLPHADPPGRLRRVAQTVVSLFRWR